MGHVLLDIVELAAAAGLLLGFMELFAPSSRKHPFHW